MHKKICCYRREDNTRCSHECNQYSDYCIWHDSRAIKDGSEILPKLENLYKKGESFEGFQLKLADLSGCCFPNVNFKNANLFRANLENSHFHNANFSGCILFKANLKNSNLNQSILNNADLLGVNLENAKLERISWGEHIIQEIKGKSQSSLDNKLNYFIEAEEIYRMLYQETNKRGLYQEASKFYYKDRTMRRLQNNLFSFARISSKAADLICGYGEKPFRTILFSFGIIFIFALIYSFLGLNTEGSNLSSYLLDCMYFSVITFTTVGYGDITPYGYSRIFAALEAFIGSFTTAVFVVVFVKKMTQ